MLFSLFTVIKIISLIRSKSFLLSACVLSVSVTATHKLNTSFFYIIPPKRIEVHRFSINSHFKNCHFRHVCIISALYANCYLRKIFTQSANPFLSQKMPQEHTLCGTFLLYFIIIVLLLLLLFNCNGYSLTVYIPFLAYGKFCIG